MKFIHFLKLPFLFNFAVFMMLLSLSVVSLTAEASNSWKLNKEEDGIQVYLRNTAGSSLKSFKSTMTVNSSLSTLIKIIEDTKSYTQWLYNCRSAKSLTSKNASETANYIVTNMPWPVIDRDTIVLSSKSQNKQNKRVEIKLSTDPKRLPEVAGKVRIEKMHGRWLLTPINKGQVNVMYELSLDPGGNIPKWIVNAMAVDLPFNTFKNLRKMIKEERYANAKVKGIID